MSAHRWAVRAAVLAACGGCALGAETQAPPMERAFGFMARGMDRFHERLDVYTDLAAAGNHFPAKAIRTTSTQASAGPTSAEDTSAPPPGTSWQS